MIDYLLGQIIHCIQESPDDKQYHYAQRMYIRTFHDERCKLVDVVFRDDECVELYVPTQFDSSRDLKDFMEENGDAIFAEKKRRLDEESKIGFKSEPLTYGSTVPFLGESLPIRAINDDDSHEVFLQDGFIFIKAGLSDTEIRAAVLKLCRNTAYEYMKPKVDHYAKIMGVEYSRLEIDDGRRTLGSFHDIYKSITLSRRLMLTNESIIDFMIVHELAHASTLRHDENHDFEMEKFLPDYEERDVAFSKTCDFLIEKGWL